ncbi:hypothetical protein AVEN_218023-1 [Araneus ventricosus]|uniref:Uncharacterized protein n=1 Tax=Araneus ventricosus TaxID=182803 RepID=A0A4Y2TMP4_ARAVE|nr:hypothetical protein AVEN_218023-1 [Araneus ventricosus]
MDASATILSMRPHKNKVIRKYPALIWRPSTPATSALLGYFKAMTRFPGSIHQESEIICSAMMVGPPLSTTIQHAVDPSLGCGDTLLNHNARSPATASNGGNTRSHWHTATHTSTLENIALASATTWISQPQPPPHLFSHAFIQHCVNQTRPISNFTINYLSIRLAKSTPLLLASQ